MNPTRTIMAGRAALLAALPLVACRHAPPPTAQGPASPADSPVAHAAVLDPAEGDGNHVVGPDFTKDPDLSDRGAPRGQRFEFELESQGSRFFRGEDPALKPENRHPFSRKIYVYIPALYKDGDDAPFLVVHDGPGPLGRMSYAIDNLSRSSDVRRRLPPFVVVAIGNGGGDAKGSERGLEYDTMSERLARFVDEEVLPAVLSNTAIRAAFPNFRLTKHPNQRGAFGCSSGGAAAFTMAWFRPDLFRRVVAYSATLVDAQNNDIEEEKMFPLGAWEYHSGQKLIFNNPAKPLRVFIHAAERDNGASSPEERHHNWPIANQRTAEALKEKGYHYRYVFSVDSGHCDDRVMDRTLADTLVWLWR